MTLVVDETVYAGANLINPQLVGQELTGVAPVTNSGAGSFTVGHVMRAYLEVRRNTLAAATQARLQLVAYPDVGPPVAIADSGFQELPVGEYVSLEATSVPVPAGTVAVQHELRLAGVGVVADHSTRRGRVVDLDTAEAGLPVRMEIETEPAPGQLVNLISNSSGELGGSGWVTSVPQSSIVATKGDKLSGFRPALRYITGETVSPASNFFYSEAFPVTAGQYLAARWNVEYALFSRYRVWFYFYNAAGAFLSQSAFTNFTQSYVAANSPTFQAPASTAFARFGFEVGTSAGTYPYTKGGESFYVRDVKVCKAAAAATLTAAAMAAAVPTPYLDVLGPTHEIRTGRSEFNLGTLSATILDASLDPAVAPTIRAGKKARLRAWSRDSGQYENLWTGELLNARVTYDARRVDDPKHARIELTGVDGLQKLAAAKRPQGVDTIAELPYVLEDAGVPWVTDGNSSQVASAALSATNENATAADQVALVRDTTLGYAWMDRYGVLQAWTDLPDPDVQLVPNGTFDVNLTGWYPWAAGAGAPTLARDTAQKYAGAASARLTTLAGATSFWMGTVDLSTTVRGAIPVLPGREYVVSAWVRSSVANRWPTLYVDWWNRGGAEPTYISTSGGDYNTPTSAVLAASTWTRVTKRVVAPAGARAADVFAGVALQAGGATAGQQVWIDSITLTPVADVANLDETAYSDLGLDFDTDRCINSIGIKWLINNVDTGETDEYQLGPYEDADSIAEWGRHHKDFTVAGRGIAPGGVIGPGAAALADKVFARNAVPEVQPTQVSIPIRDVADLTAARAFLELYDLVRVKNAAKALNYRARVTHITHRLTPKGWYLDLEFASASTVAMPQVQPAFQSPEPYAEPYLEAVLTASGNVAAAWVDLPNWTITAVAGFGSLAPSTIGSTITVTRPGRYRLHCVLVFDAAGTVGAGRAGRFVVAGVDQPYASGSGLGSFAYSTVEIDKTMRLAAGATIKVQAITSALVNVMGGLAGVGLSRLEIDWLAP